MVVPNAKTAKKQLNTLTSVFMEEFNKKASPKYNTNNKNDAANATNTHATVFIYVIVSLFLLNIFHLTLVCQSVLKHNYNHSHLQCLFFHDLKYNI